MQVRGGIAVKWIRLAVFLLLLPLCAGCDPDCTTCPGAGGLPVFSANGDSLSNYLGIARESNGRTIRFFGDRSHGLDYLVVSTVTVEDSAHGSTELNFDAQKRISSIVLDDGTSASFEYADDGTIGVTLYDSSVDSTIVLSVQSRLSIMSAKQSVARGAQQKSRMGPLQSADAPSWTVALTCNDTGRPFRTTLAAWLRLDETKRFIRIPARPLDPRSSPYSSEFLVSAPVWERANKARLHDLVCRILGGVALKAGTEIVVDLLAVNCGPYALGCRAVAAKLADLGTDKLLNMTCAAASDLIQDEVENDDLIPQSSFTSGTLHVEIPGPFSGSVGGDKCEKRIGAARNVACAEFPVRFTDRQKLLPWYLDGRVPSPGNSYAVVGSRLLRNNPRDGTLDAVVSGWIRCYEPGTTIFADLVFGSDYANPLWGSGERRADASGHFAFQVHNVPLCELSSLMLDFQIDGEQTASQIVSMPYPGSNGGGGDRDYLYISESRIGTVKVDGGSVRYDRSSGLFYLGQPLGFTDNEVSVHNETVGVRHMGLTTNSVEGTGGTLFECCAGGGECARVALTGSEDVVYYDNDKKQYVELQGIPGSVLIEGTSLRSSSRLVFSFLADHSDSRRRFEHAIESPVQISGGPSMVHIELGVDH